MKTSTREELSRRLNALVEDFLDHVAGDEDTAAGFDLGVVMILAEVLHGREEPLLRRADGG